MKGDTMTTTTLDRALSNTQALELATDGTTEIVRAYQVTIHKPGLFDDDGSPIFYDTEVTLRYTAAKADRRPAASFDARLEAATRAVKLERKFYRMPETRALYVDPEVDVTFLREAIRPARKAA